MQPAVGTFVYISYRRQTRTEERDGLRFWHSTPRVSILGYTPHTEGDYRIIGLQYQSTVIVSKHFTVFPELHKAGRIDGLSSQKFLSVESG